MKELHSFEVLGITDQMTQDHIPINLNPQSCCIALPF